MEKKTVGKVFEHCEWLLNGNKEYDKILKETKKYWEKWTDQVLK